MPPRRVLVAGYYGHGNLGDEAILEAMLAGLREARPDVEVTVVSGHPERTVAHHSVRAVHERDWTALIDAAGASDAIVLGGGGLFHDYFGTDENTLFTRAHWGLSYCAAFPTLASWFDRPFMLYAVGVGPLRSGDGAKFTRLTFERADRATLRDEASAALVRSMGAATERVSVTADPAFLLTSSPADRVQAVLREAGVPAGKRLVAVAVRPWEKTVPADQWQAPLAAALDQLVTDGSTAIVFVPFQSGQDAGLTDDRAASERVHRLMKHAGAATIAGAIDRPADAQGLFAGADLVIAMRLHAAILAANAETPIVAIAYDPKVRHVMDQLGLGDYALDLEHLTAPALVERANAAAANRAGIRRSLGERVPALRTAATRNTTVHVDLLDRPWQPAAPFPPEWAALLTRALLSQTKRASVHEAGVEFLRGELTTSARRLAEREAALAALSRLLEERTQDLAVVTARLAEARSDLEATPATSYRRLRQRARNVGRAWSRVMRAVGRPPAWFVRAIYRTIVPVAARNAIRRAASGRLMSWPDYLFDRYKRSRSATYGPSLNGLRDAGERGLVSVVLPAYTGAALIRESIDSVLAQTYRSFELIVVDDGSTDETAQIAESYSRVDARVRVIRQPHGRLPRALSHGFRQARGEFLTWTSCDNRMKPAFLSRMVDCLKRHPDWDMAYANLDIIGERGELLTQTTFYDGSQKPPGSGHVHLPASTAQLNVVANNSVGAAFLYRARVATLLGDYSPHRFVMEDYDYWMRVNAALTLRHADFDEPVYDYRFHSQSLTSRWTEFDMLKNRERLMVFDDFRRDSFLTPMLWVIDGQGPLAIALSERVRRAGHLVYDGRYPLPALPRASVAVAFVHVTDQPDRASVGRVDLPATALKVLLTGAATLPPRVLEEWDLCCASGAPGALPRLGRPHQGWLAGNLDVLFQAIDIRAKSAHLEALEATAEGADPPALRASVVVCTRRRTDQVLTTLGAIATQSLPSSAYELIVVGNDVHDVGAAAAVEEVRARHFRDQPDRLRHVLCPIAGLSPARNAGLAEARGEIVAFLDDDAVPAEDWLAHLVAAYDAHPEAGVIGGHIALAPPSPRPRAPKRGWEKYWSEYLTEHQRFAEAGDWRQFPWGANWSARRVALRQAGGFRTRYGRSGDNYWGGEELVAACLIQRLGYAIGVAPQARASHHVSADRYTFTHVRRTMTAGHQVGHHAQRDLYLPRARHGLLPGVGQLLTHHVDRALEPGLDRWIDAIYRKRAQARLVAAEVADIGRRARRPIVAAR